MPLVSIVTTSYRHAPFLSDYFEGLLAQTYRNIELVFINDGSPDDTWQIAKGYEGELSNWFSRVVLINQANQGMFRAFKHALSQATGELICLLESDDYYLPGKVEENVAYLIDKPRYGMVHSDCDFIYGDGVEEAHWRNRGDMPPTGMVFEDLLSRHFVMTCTACYRREAINRYGRMPLYQRRGYLMGDYPLNLDIAKALPLGYIDRPLARYRVLAESASHSRDPLRAIRFRLSGIRISRDFAVESGNARSKIGKGVRDSLYGAAYWARAANGYKEAFSAYITAMLTWGPDRRAITGIAKLAPHWFATNVLGRTADISGLMPHREGVHRT